MPVVVVMETFWNCKCNEKKQIKTSVLADIYREISWVIKCLSFIIWKRSKMHLVFLMKEITHNFLNFLKLNRFIWITAFKTKSFMGLSWRLITWDKISEQLSACINPDRGTKKSLKISMNLGHILVTVL